MILKFEFLTTKLTPFVFLETIYPWYVLFRANLTNN
jgi:hypothetical protein